MGLDTNRFEFPNAIGDELICPICNDVLEEPRFASKCEHYFCRECIESWLTGNFTCPIDRQHLEKSDLQPPQRLMKSLQRKRVIIHIDFR